MGNAESGEGSRPKGEALEKKETVGTGVVNVLMKLGCVSGQDACDGPEEDVTESPLDPPHALDGVAATFEEANDLKFHRDHQVHQMNKQEAIFLREFKTMMTSGFKLIEHGPGGAFATRTLRLTADERHIVWDDTDATSTLALADVKRVSCDGKGRVPEDVADRCLVLEAAARVLVFETVDTETRELIADGFDLMLGF